MNAIILCQFRSDQADIRSVLTRRTSTLLLAGKAKVLFIGEQSDRQSSNQILFWALAISGLAEAESLVTSWQRQDECLRGATIFCLKREHDFFSEIGQALFP